MPMRVAWSGACSLVGDLELGTEVLVDGATPPGHWKARSYTRLLAPLAGWVPTAALGTSFKVLDHGDVRMGSFRDFSMHCRAGLADVWAKNTATGALPGAIKAFCLRSRSHATLKNYQ